MAPLIGQYSLFVTLLTHQLFAWVYLNSGPDITKRVPSSDREREELSIDVNDSVRIDEKKNADDQKCGQLWCPAPYYPGQKKAPSSRFAARRTLFDLVISCSMMHHQGRACANSSATVRDFCPALIVRHQA